MKLGSLIIGESDYITLSQTGSITDTVLDGKAKLVVADVLPNDYLDISTIENWDKFGVGLLGSVFGFKDWKCLRNEIKTLVLEKTSNDINANWSELSSNEKIIACEYLPNIVSAINFATTITDPAEQAEIANNFANNSKDARLSRYNAVYNYTMGMIAVKMDGIVILKDIATLTVEYIQGIEYKEWDGTEGLIDYVEATAGTSFAGAGLPAKNYTLNHPSMTWAQFCNTLSNILKNGAY